MIHYVIWFAYHVYSVWSPHFRGRTLPVSAVWFIPFSFCSGALLLYGEWYAVFFLLNSVLSAIQLLTAAATFAAPPGPADTERALDGAAASLLRVVMTVFVLISTLFL